MFDLLIVSVDNVMVALLFLNLPSFFDTLTYVPIHHL